MPRKQVLTPEVLHEVYRRQVAGESLKALADEFSVAYGTLRTRLSRYKKESNTPPQKPRPPPLHEPAPLKVVGELEFQARRIDALEARLAQLELARAPLRRNAQAVAPRREQVLKILQRTGHAMTYLEIWDMMDDVKDDVGVGSVSAIRNAVANLARDDKVVVFKDLERRGSRRIRVARVRLA